MSKKLNEARERLLLIEEFCALWNAYFQFFSDEQKAIDDSPQNEGNFLHVTQQLMLRHYALCERMHDVFDDGDPILKLLGGNSSLAKLKGLPDTEFDRIQVSWHEIFLRLNKARGKVEHSMPAKILEALRQMQAEGRRAA